MGSGFQVHHVSLLIVACLQVKWFCAQVKPWIMQNAKLYYVITTTVLLVLCHWNKKHQAITLFVQQPYVLFGNIEMNSANLIDVHGLVLRGIIVACFQWEILCSDPAKRRILESYLTDVTRSKLMGRRLKLPSLSGLPASKNSTEWEATIAGSAKCVFESSCSLVEDGIYFRTAPRA